MQIYFTQHYTPTAILFISFWCYCRCCCGALPVSHWWWLSLRGESGWSRTNEWYDEFSLLPGTPKNVNGIVLAQLRWRCNWWWGLGLVVRIIFPSTPSIKCKIVFILASVIFRIYCYPGPNNGTICHKNKNTALFIYFNSDLAQTSWSHPVPCALSPVAKLLSFARADRTRLFEWGWMWR